MARHLVVPHLDLTDALAADLADGPEPVRLELAGRRDLPPRIRDRLAADDDLDVRLRLLLNPEVPADLCERVQAGFDAEDRPAFPTDAFPRLARSESTPARLLALHGRDLPESLVAGLLDDPEPEIRRAAARHPNVPLKRLPALLTGPDAEIAEAAGAAPAMPATWFPRLPGRPRGWLRT